VVEKDLWRLGAWDSESTVATSVVDAKGSICHEELSCFSRTGEIWEGGSMKIVTVVIAAFAFLVIVGNASAGGYAGSRYEKSDCTYTKSTNVLY
jgi:hypothetical protein